jgi:hypothetical protein
MGAVMPDPKELAPEEEVIAKVRALLVDLPLIEVMSVLTTLLGDAGHQAVEQGMGTTKDFLRTATTALYNQLQLRQQLLTPVEKEKMN